VAYSSSILDINYDILFCFLYLTPVITIIRSSIRGDLFITIIIDICLTVYGTYFFPNFTVILNMK